MEDARQAHSDKVDRWVTGPVTGPLIFLVAMWAVFQITTLVAMPLQRLLGEFFTGPLSRWAVDGLTVAGLQNHWLRGLIVDGIITGVGTLLSFVPLMAVMFILLALMEQSGYMSRAAVVASSAMRGLGLPGQAFLPLIVGFGCNVPGVLASSELPDVRQRRLTVLLVPFTSCSARLSVYLLISSAFFGRWAGTAVFAMYLVSILLVVGVGLALRHTLWRALPDPSGVIDLAPYQRPRLAATVRAAWLRLKDFLVTASGVIVGVVVVVWALQATPAGPGFGTFGHVVAGDSIYAVVARAVAHLFTPAGFGDWGIASALIAGFVAKEAVVSSLAQTFAGSDLTTALHQVFSVSSGGHQLAAVAAFLVFVLAYTPCVATLAAMRRRIGARWSLFGVAMQLIVAWVLAVVVFHIGSRL